MLSQQTSTSSLIAAVMLDMCRSLIPQRLLSCSLLLYLYLYLSIQKQVEAEGGERGGKADTVCACVCARKRVREMREGKAVHLLSSRKGTRGRAGVSGTELGFTRLSGLRQRRGTGGGPPGCLIGGRYEALGLMRLAVGRTIDGAGTHGLGSHLCQFFFTRLVGERWLPKPVWLHYRRSPATGEGSLHAAAAFSETAHISLRLQMSSADYLVLRPKFRPSSALPRVDEGRDALHGARASATAHEDGASGTSNRPTSPPRAGRRTAAASYAIFARTASDLAQSKSASGKRMLGSKLPDEKDRAGCRTNIVHEWRPSRRRLDAPTTLDSYRDHELHFAAKRKVDSRTYLDHDPLLQRTGDAPVDGPGTEAATSFGKRRVDTSQFFLAGGGPNCVRPFQISGRKHVAEPGSNSEDRDLTHRSSIRMRPAGGSASAGTGVQEHAEDGTPIIAKTLAYEFAGRLHDPHRFRDACPPGSMDTVGSATAPTSVAQLRSNVSLYQQLKARNGASLVAFTDPLYDKKS